VRSLHSALAAGLLALVACLACAKEAPLLAQDPVLEARVMDLAGELRCLVCQNETLAASHADLAVDLREQIREKLRAGQSRQQVIDFLVDRYGEFVLYRPRFTATTLLLWLGPFLLLVIAAIVLFRTIRQQKPAGPPAELCVEQVRRARELLGGTQETPP
jgi:cytochrome c-type biogenesis protein CcmH